MLVTAAYTRILFVLIKVTDAVSLEGEREPAKVDLSWKTKRDQTEI